MRIMLFAAGGDIGGGKTHILSLARELAKDNELRLVSFRREVLSKEAREMGIDTADIEGDAGMLRTYRFAREQAEAFRPDVIHCHGAKANLLGVLIKRALKIPVITTVHSDYRLDYMGRPLQRATNGVLNAWALRHMDYYVAVADGMRHLLIDRGFDGQRIFTVYNGLDFSGASDEARPEKPADEPIVVGIAARLNPVKDIPTLLKGFAAAYRKDPRLRLSIAGIGEEEASLRSLADKLGIAPVTVFEGWIGDVKAYFRRVDINVLTSLSETFPYSLLEGAYVHCPAIASKVGGIPYLIENEKTGLLFNSGDSEALASAILRLAGDAPLRSRLAEGLYRKAKNEFSLARMAKDQEEIYRTLLARSARRDRYGAILCGAYGRGNAGDEAILRAILIELRSIDPYMPFYVMSRDPKKTMKAERVGSFYIFNVLAFFRALAHTELFVSGGGTLIQDATSSRSLLFYLFTLLSAKRRGTRILMYGCGIGPVNREKNRRRVGRVLNRTADIITVRDSASIELLDIMGVTEPEIALAADPTVNLPLLSKGEIDAEFAAEGIPADAPKIAFCLREWKDFDGFEPVARAAEYAWKEHGLLPVFIAMENPSDLPLSERMAAMVDAPAYVCRRQHGVSEMIGMLGAMKVVCGMRLHSLIFATAGGAPIVAISYDVKVAGFARDCGCERCIDLYEMNDENLQANIRAALQAGTDEGAAAREKLKTKELLNCEAARRLLGKGPSA